MSLRIYVLQISTLTKKCFKNFCNGFTFIGKKGNIRSFSTWKYSQFTSSLKKVA